MSPKKASSQSSAEKNAGRYLLELEVRLIGGPLEQDFVADNPVVSRTVQMRSDQTLETLHYVIFDAFDREEEHLHEFQVGGKQPMDKTARRYTIGKIRDADYQQDSDGTVERTSLGQLGLPVGAVFFYWFDFGDDWWHEIEVKAIRPEVPRGRFPKLVKKVGQSPPQYPTFGEDELEQDDEDLLDDWDDDDDWDDEDDDWDDDEEF